MTRSAWWDINMQGTVLAGDYGRPYVASVTFENAPYQSFRQNIAITRKMSGSQIIVFEPMVSLREIAYKGYGAWDKTKECYSPNSLKTVMGHRLKEVGITDLAMREKLFRVDGDHVMIRNLSDLFQAQHGLRGMSDIFVEDGKVRVLDYGGRELKSFEKVFPDDTRESGGMLREWGY